MSESIVYFCVCTQQANSFGPQIFMSKIGMVNPARVIMGTNERHRVLNLPKRLCKLLMYYPKVFMIIIIIILKIHSNILQFFVKKVIYRKV